MMSAIITNLSAVVSQRVKLACKDMAYADSETVFARLISQGRDMDEQQIRDEMSRVMKLTEQAMGRVEAMKTNGREEFTRKIMDMELSRDALSMLLNQSADKLRSTMESSRVGHWDVSESVYRDLELVSKLSSEGKDSGLGNERLVELLSYVKSSEALIAMADKRSVHPEENKQDKKVDKAEDELSLNAIKELRDKGLLPADFSGMSESRIKSIMDSCRSDPRAKLSDKELIELWGKTMVSDMVLSLADMKADCGETFVWDEDEMSLRRSFIVAVFMNLRACGKLPEGLAELSEEDLATVACAGAEINYYFDKAAGPSFNFDMDEVIEDLSIGVFMLSLAVPALSEGAALLGGILLVIAVGSAFLAMNEVLKALFPAGLSETRLGVCLSRSAAQARRKLSELAKNCLDSLEKAARNCLSKLVLFAVDKLLLPKLDEEKNEAKSKEEKREKQHSRAKQEEQSHQYQKA